MARLLYLVHRIPYPPNKGDKIRSYNILKALACDHEIVLGTFIDDPDDAQHKATLEAMCSDVYFETIDPKTQKSKSLLGLLSGSPLTVTFYRSKTFQAWVDAKIAEGIDGIVLFSSAMARFMRWDVVSGIPVWMDFVDLDSDKWQQYASSKSGPEAWIYRREAKTLLNFEREIAARVQTSSFVTTSEVALFRENAGDAAPAVVAMPNGVDLDQFSPSFRPDDDGPDNEIVFTGAMDYWANVDAVVWFADAVLPRIQAQISNATFTIVGSKPTKAVLALQAREGISVTGFVDDTRSYIVRAHVCVAPMRIARGVQNKVLEAMAMGKAVVTTSAGYEGIEASPDQDLVVCDDVDAFAQHCIDLLNDANRRLSLGENARRAMEDTYNWHVSLEPIKAFADQAGNRKF